METILEIMEPTMKIMESTLEIMEPTLMESTLEIMKNTTTEITFFKNEINNYSISELEYIRETIQNMNKFNQIEVLRIFSKYNKSNEDTIILNENKYGIHINLSDIPKEILDNLILYIKYVNTQELSLCNIEKQKESFKNIYFTKDNKDINKIISNELSKLK